MTHVLDSEFVAKLRTFTRPPGKKKMCIDELSDDQLQEVYFMLKSNSKQWSYSNISKFIKETWGALQGYDQAWVADVLSRFSDQVLGPRRGLARQKGTTNPEEHKVRDRMKKREELAKRQLSEIVELGKQMIHLDDEIDYWTQRGQERDAPFDAYVPKLLSIYETMAKTRHQMKVTEGLIRPAPSQLDINVRQASAHLFSKFDDSKQVVDFLSAFNKNLESIAEPVDVTKLIPEKTNETELQRENGQWGGSSLVYDQDGIPTESEHSGPEDL